MGRNRTTPNSRGRRPGVLAPWLATGAGLVALVVTPEVDTTEPAYAFAPTNHSSEASPSLGSSFARMANASDQLTATGRILDPASVSTALTSVSLSSRSPAGLSPSSTTFRLDIEPSIPRPLTSNAKTSLGDLPVSMEQKWAQLRHCEATNNYEATNRSGKYRGAYQFDQDTWQSVGGSGDPASATPVEQDKRARILFERRGSSPWPECGRYLD